MEARATEPATPAAQRSGARGALSASGPYAAAESPSGVSKVKYVVKDVAYENCHVNTHVCSMRAQHLYTAGVISSTRLVSILVT